MNPIYRSRRRNDVAVRLLCLFCAMFGVTWLALILFTLFYNGLAGITLLAVVATCLMLALQAVL